jgi:hypothetical protein
MRCDLQYQRGELLRVTTVISVMMSIDFHTTQMGGETIGTWLSSLAIHPETARRISSATVCPFVIRSRAPPWANQIVEFPGLLRTEQA